MNTFITPIRDRCAASASRSHVYRGRPSPVVSCRSRKTSSSRASL
ncbi:hypothetical protein NFA_39360 [Nocardia farcinica IFM 10152]|uniref:Uncharacterized protein n=1 Tax=Nocardia farcinica (strain IFM 10152) TaxID=247156 RepID=Q5YSQ7_NOCFA|nr:hypothetical protein NFA_39360 [Nocardia farcinica IFM 10152]